MTTFFSNSPVKVVFEASAQGIDKIPYSVIRDRALSDNHIVAACKVANDIGIEVLYMPHWVSNALIDPNYVGVSV